MEKEKVLSMEDDHKYIHLRSRSIKKSEYVKKGGACSPRKSYGGNKGKGYFESWDDSVLFFLGASIAVLLIYWTCFKQKPFCDSPSELVADLAHCGEIDGCLACPLEASCAKGKMVRLSLKGT